MAIRAKKPEISSTVIMTVTVDMVNRQHQRLAIPDIFQFAQRTAVWNS